MVIWNPFESLPQAYPVNTDTPFYTCFCYVVGGVISPILCNMALDGLQDLVIKGRNKKRHKLNIIRYADDFIITGASKDILVNELKPEVEIFWLNVGLLCRLRKLN